MWRQLLVFATVCLACVVPASGQWPVSKGLEKQVPKSDPTATPHISVPKNGHGGAAAATMGRPSPPSSLSIEGSGDVVERADAILVVRFEGGDVPAEAARVLRLLIEQKVVGVEPHTVADGDTICDVYKSYTNFPGLCAKELTDLARWINGNRLNPKMLPVDGDVLVPAVRFDEYRFSVRLAPTLPADRDRLIDLRKNWGWLIIEESKTAEGLVQLRLRGYQFRVSVPDANVIALKNAVFKAPRPNVVVGIIPAKAAQRPSYSVDDAKKFFVRCRNRSAAADDRGSMMRLIGAESRLCQRPCIGDRDCPGTVVLVDSMVHHHPDLGGAVLDSEGRPAGALEDGYCEVVDPFDHAQHHGTYMAGIMVSGGQKSRLVGIDHDARVISLRWDASNDEFTVAEKMDDMNQGNMRIFVLASGWSLDPQLGDIPKFRLDKHPMAKFIAGNHVRVIAAAGQKAGAPGTEIGPKSLMGPMNLGDQTNVVVVTACEDCDGPNVRLRPDANYGSPTSRFVHVAAPGSDIPSTASEKAYATQSGTSPAAALVGGLASAMLGCYSSLADIGKLKERLQVTSRPIIGEDRDKVATGVVDATMALRDPQKNYARLVGTAMKEVAVQGWCQSSISLYDAQTGQGIENGNLETRNIVRLVRVVDGDRPEWVAYARKEGFPGVIVKVGPGTMGPFTVPAPQRYANLDKPLIRLQDTGNVSLRRIEDLLVHAALRTNACP